MSEESQIKEFIQRGFEEIYMTTLSTASRAPCICSQWQPRLSEEKKVSISGGVTEEEVKAALWSLKTFKALGSDGLHAGFFQRFWPTMGKSVVDEVKKIFEERKIPEYLNKTYIVPIPKIQGPKTLGNFRLISLCNTIYKVVTKIIVARLRPLLEKLISPLQTSFVSGRKGIDNATGKKKGKVGNMVLKIDLEKTYDKL